MASFTVCLPNTRLDLVSEFVDDYLKRAIGYRDEALAIHYTGSPPTPEKALATYSEDDRTRDARAGQTRKILWAVLELGSAAAKSKRALGLLGLVRHIDLEELGHYKPDLRVRNIETGYIEQHMSAPTFQAKRALFLANRHTLTWREDATLGAVIFKTEPPRVMVTLEPAAPVKPVLEVWNALHGLREALVNRFGEELSQEQTTVIELSSPREIIASPASLALTFNLPSRPSDFNRWCNIYHLVRKGKSTSLTVKCDRLFETHSLGCSEKTMGKILRAGAAGMLDRKV